MGLLALTMLAKKSTKEASTEQHLEMNSNLMDYVFAVPQQVILFYVQYYELIYQTPLRTVCHALLELFQVIFSQEYYEIHIIVYALVSTDRTPILD